MTTHDLMRELRLLGQVDVPQEALERGLRRLALDEYRAFVEVPWDLIIEDRERRAREMANVLATAQAVEADNPRVSPSGVAAQGRVCAARPVAPSTLPGLRSLGAECSVGVSHA